MEKAHKHTVAVDFDGTLAQYQKGDLEKFGPQYTGEPIPEMVAKVKQALAEGSDVCIFTARVNPGADFERSLAATQSYLIIAAWCQKNLGVLLPIIYQKQTYFDELWDDKAKEVIPNHGLFVSELMEATQGR